MKCETTRDLDCDKRCDEALVTVTADGRRIVKSGTVIDEAVHLNADCVTLVRMGLGIPLDDECREASQRTWGQIVEAQEAIRKMYTIPKEDDEPEDADE